MKFIKVSCLKNDFWYIWHNFFVVLLQLQRDPEVTTKPQIPDVSTTILINSLDNNNTEESRQTKTGKK